METARRRSSLSVPVVVGRMVTKARGTAADEVILDLEDSIPADRKEEARQRLLSVCAPRSEWGQTLSVRVNAPRTPWCHHDLEVAVAVAPAIATIVVPKVEGSGDLAFIDRLLEGLEAAAGHGAQLRIQALVETATGLANVAEIARSSSRLDALILGYADLAASMGRPFATLSSQAVWHVAQETIVLAARANGLQAIDGPYLGTRPDAKFDAAVTTARDMGFDGKWAIHPSQVGLINDAFTPTVSEMETASRVLEALDEAESHGPYGALDLDGQMIDQATRVNARRTLARGMPGA